MSSYYYEVLLFKLGNKQVELKGLAMEAINKALNSTEKLNALSEIRMQVILSSANFKYYILEEKVNGYEFLREMFEECTNKLLKTQDQA